MGASTSRLRRALGGSRLAVRDGRRCDVFRRHCHTRLYQPLESPPDHCDAAVARLHHLERHPGAGRLVGSVTVNNDLAARCHAHLQRLGVRALNVVADGPGRLDRALGELLAAPRIQ